MIEEIDDEDKNTEERKEELKDINEECEAVPDGRHALRHLRELKVEIGLLIDDTHPILIEDKAWWAEKQERTIKSLDDESFHNDNTEFIINMFSPEVRVRGWTQWVTEKDS